jgi:hypothetical protein
MSNPQSLGDTTEPVVPVDSTAADGKNEDTDKKIDAVTSVLGVALTKIAKTAEVAAGHAVHLTAEGMGHVDGYMAERRERRKAAAAEDQNVDHLASTTDTGTEHEMGPG